MAPEVMSASEWLRELLERVAAKAGVEARVELEEDADGVSREPVPEARTTAGD